MPIFRLREKVLLFVHIPKTGGTTVENFLSEHGKIALFARGNVGPCPPQHWEATMTSMLVPSGFFDYAFSVTRHPFDRILSEYRYRCDLGQVNPASDGFGYWFSRATRKFTAQPHIMENHIRPQSEFLFDGCEALRFEDGFKKLFSTVGTRVGIDLDWDGRHHKKSSSLTVSLSEADLEAVRLFYQVDFDRFGYDPSFEAFFRRRTDVVRGEGPLPPTVSRVHRFASNSIYGLRRIVRKTLP